jgi:hypothetical protein
MNRHDRRAEASLRRRSHDAETRARVEGMRAGNPAKDTVLRAEMLEALEDQIRTVIRKTRGTGKNGLLVLRIVDGDLGRAYAEEAAPEIDLDAFEKECLATGQLPAVLLATPIDGMIELLALHHPNTASALRAKTFGPDEVVVACIGFGGASVFYPPWSVS